MRRSEIKYIITQYYRSRLEGVDAADTKKLFAEWFSEGNDEKEKIEALFEVWEKQRAEGREINIKVLAELREKAGLSPATRKPTARKLTPMQIMTRVAAVVIPVTLIAGGILFLNRGDGAISTAEMVEITVPNAEQQEVTMGDGTRFVASAGSKISYTKDVTAAGQRIVELEGESYFEVERDEEKPFVVKTKELTITVLGTTFNIEAYPERDVTIVTLNSGRLEVKTVSEKSVILSPNQQLIYAHTTGRCEIKHLSTEEATDAIDWKHGDIIFDNMPLYDICMMLERRYDVQVEIRGSIDSSRRYTARFDGKEDLEYVMTLLQMVIPEIEYHIDDKKLMLSSQ